jgi:hypothetical protein
MDALPISEPGCGICVRAGWEDDEDGNPQFEVLLVYTNGPPDFPLSAFFHQKSMRISVVEET